MRAIAAFLGLMLVALPASAQIAPTPGNEDPRLQTVVPVPGAPLRLVVFPDAPLTLVFRPGEQVERVLVSDSGAFEVAVVGHNDSLSISPLRPEAGANITVTTNRQQYPLEVATGTGLAAAYLVRIVEMAPPPSATLPVPLTAPIELAGMSGKYRVSGSRALRPTEIADDGSKTYIRWGEYQAIPAVFGVGPSGSEEVVNGYMRGDRFTIDRVYDSLVFRIDAKRASARRMAALASR